MVSVPVSVRRSVVRASSLPRQGWPCVTVRGIPRNAVAIPRTVVLNSGAPQPSIASCNIGPPVASAIVTRTCRCSGWFTSRWSSVDHPFHCTSKEHRCVLARAIHSDQHTPLADATHALPRCLVLRPVCPDIRGRTRQDLRAPGFDSAHDARMFVLAGVAVGSDREFRPRERSPHRETGQRLQRLDRPAGQSRRAHVQ